LESVVLCEYHGEVHPRQVDYYDCGDRECNSTNWRNVAALGTAAEIDGY
jgi:hypothetical protein